MPKKSQSSQFLTKRDIQNLTSKEDLKVLESKLESKIENVEQKLGEKLDKIANTLDGFVGTVDNLRIENEVGANQIHELRKRVTKLESSQAA